MSVRNVIKRSGIIICLAAIVSIMMLLFTVSIACAADDAPEWTSYAVKEDTKTVTLGNPYTPAQFITDKWTDPYKSNTYYYSVDDSEPALCSDYTGSEGQVKYFAYTFDSLGRHTLKVWAKNGDAESEPYVATVKVVDPATYEYTMTIKVSNRVNLKFYECEGFNEKAEDIPGDEILSKRKLEDGTEDYIYTVKLKAGTYSFRGTDRAGNDLGGMSFRVPNEAKTAGSSETVIYVRELDVGCGTKYDETNYCTEEHFIPHVTTYGHEAVYGSTFTNSGMTFFRTMVLAASNDITYQYYLEATDAAKEYGFADGGFSSSFVVSAASAAQRLQIDLGKAKDIQFKVPEGSEIRIFFQRGYYATFDKTSHTFVEKVPGENGTETWKFCVPNQIGRYTWRVCKEGRLTKAGYLTGTTKDLDLTEDDACSPDSTVTTAGDFIDNSILLNVNSRNALDLSVGDEFILKAYRGWEIIDDPGTNCMIEPDFHTELISGENVVEIEESDLGNGSGNRVKLTAKKAGLAAVRVKYDAIQIYGISDSGVYGACDKNCEGIVLVQVGAKNTSRVSFGITGDTKRNSEWDADFDICYFQGESGSVYVNPRSDDGIASVSVADPEQLSFTEIEKKDGRYTAIIKPGSNVICVTTESGEKHYQIVRGCRYSYVLTNLTRAGEAPVAGDTVKIHLTGLYMPVHKMAGVYNPGFEGTGKVSYVTEEGDIVTSPGTQYDYILKQDVTVTIPGYSGGQYVLGKGQMSISIMAAPNCIGLHRSILEGGLNTMFNAVSNAWKGSVLEDLAIPVSKTDHGLLFTGMIEGSEIKLVNSEGLKLIPDEANSEFISFPELPDGEYDYSVTCENYGAVTGKAVLSSEDSGQKEIKIEQKLNDQDVQAVVDAIKALPQVGTLTKEDVDKVDAAKSGFDALSDEQRGYVNRELKDKLDALVQEARILKDDDVMNVIGLIKALPDVSGLTLDNKAEVEEANKAYNALTDEQKELVGNTLAKRLSDINNKIAALITEKENQDAADMAAQYINELPALDAIMLSDKDKVEQAKASYDSLSRQQKALVSDSLKLKLQDSVNKIKELQEQAEREEQDRAAANGVEQQISNLPVLDAMTLEDKAKVEQARDAFNSLTDAQKSMVSSEATAVLISAEDKIKELEVQAEKEKEEAERQKAEQEKKDKAAADEVEQQIGNLPVLDAMTLEDKTKVEQARASYDSLTDAQKSLVSSEVKATLESAEDRIKELKDQAEQAEREKEQAEKEKEETEKQKAEQEKKDKAAADEVEQQIGNLPVLDAMTLEDKTKVEQAREAYDSLTDDQKALVSSEEKAALRSSEDRIKELEAQAEQAEKEKEEAERQKAEQEKKDKAAAEEAEILIAKIPALDAIKLEDKDKVEQARKYYNSLTEIQKSLVPFGFHAILVDAENRIIELEQIQTAKAYKVKIKAKALKKHKVKITWKKLSGTTGYEVYRATKKTGKYTHIKTLKNLKKASFTNKKLKKGKNYYYKVKPYTVISGKAYTGKWSNIVKVKVK